MKKKLKLIFIWLLFTSYSFAQISVNSSVDKKEITIGDSFMYTLTIKCPKEYKFESPNFEYILKNFEIRNQKTEKKDKLNIYQFELTSYTTGQQIINSFEIEFISPKNEKKVIRQNEIPVFVKFMFSDLSSAEDIRDIKPQLLPKRSVVLYLIFFVLILTAIFLFLHFRSKKNIKNEPLPVEKILSPEEIAYRGLELLNSSDLIAKGKIKEFYIELSEIVRKFLAMKYRISVIERTTGEIFLDLKKILDMKKTLEIKEFLESCDLVKFAKYIPPVEQIQDDFKKAKEIIDKLSQKEG